jgi:MFS family permease
MGAAMMASAVVSDLTAVVHNYTGLVLVRFFLGLTEAAYYPGAVYMLSIFYTPQRDRNPNRHSIHRKHSRHGICWPDRCRCFHGLDNKSGLAGWQWLFILQGAVTFLVAAIGFFCLPDFPLTTKWLTEEEWLLAHSRMEADTVGNKGDASTFAGFVASLRGSSCLAICVHGSHAFGC